MKLRDKKAEWKKAEDRFFEERQLLQSDAEKRKLLMRYSEDRGGCSVCGDPTDDFRSIPSLKHSTQVIVESGELQNKFLCYDCAFSRYKDKNPNANLRDFENFFVNQEKPGIYRCNLCKIIRVMFEAEIGFWQRDEHKSCWRQRCTLTAVYADDIFNCPDCKQRKCRAGQDICDSCQRRRAYQRGVQEKIAAQVQADIEAAKLERQERIRVAEEKVQDHLMNESLSKSETQQKFAENQAKEN